MTIEEALDSSVVLFNYERITYNMNSRRALGTRNIDLINKYGIKEGKPGTKHAFIVEPGSRSGILLVYLDLEPRNHQWRSFWTGNVKSFEIVPMDEVNDYLR